MTLYNKYRPDAFEDFIGNDETVKSLKNAITKKNHSHVYLLSGPPGTGKTTIARIMAKMLNASEMDIREINTSSARGIDTAREIIQQIRMLPFESNSKIVYILDECHKFTNDMQNALLKPLEDTPEHVYFFLCTTEPQKIIKAIHSRCTEIKTKSLSVDQIFMILRRVNKLEELKISKELLTCIADHCEGSPRKALVTLERVAAVDDDKERNKIIEQTIPDEEDVDIINFCRALINEKNGWRDLASILKTLKENGKLDDPENVRYVVMGYMSSILLSGKVNKRAAIALESFSEPTYNTGKNGIILATFNTITQ